MYVNSLSRIPLLLLLLMLANKSIAQQKIAEQKEGVHFDIGILLGLEGIQGRASMNEVLAQHNFINLSDRPPLTLGLEFNVTNKRNLFKAAMWFTGLDSVDGNAYSNIRRRTFIASYGYDLLPKSQFYLFPFGGLALSVTRMDGVSKNRQLLITTKSDLLFQSGIAIKFISIPDQPRSSFIPTVGIYAGTFLPIIKGAWKTDNASEEFVSGKMSSRFHRFLTITVGLSF